MYLVLILRYNNDELISDILLSSRKAKVDTKSLRNIVWKIKGWNFLHDQIFKALRTGWLPQIYIIIKEAKETFPWVEFCNKSNQSILVTYVLEFFAYT